jgi:hypothetical protein
MAVKLGDIMRSGQSGGVDVPGRTEPIGFRNAPTHSGVGDSDVGIQKGDLLVVRRVVPLAFLFGMALIVAMAWTGPAIALEVKKETAPAPKQEAPKTDAAKKDEAKGEPAKKEEAAKKEPEKVVETPPPTVPKEVEEKLEKARLAVAEAIVAAQDAGLVDSSIDPPPILDILIKGYAIDARTLKNPSAKKTFWAVTPEVFCGWFTGYNKTLEGVTINPMNDLRIINPSAGLKAWYDQRANMLNKYIDEVRKAKGQTAAPKPAEVKKEAAKPAEVRNEEAKKK